MADFVVPLPGETKRQMARLRMRSSSGSNVAGIYAAATTGTDCTRSAITWTSISSPGAASPFSAAISGAISSPRERLVKIGAKVVIHERYVRSTWLRSRGHGICSRKFSRSLHGCR